MKDIKGLKLTNAGKYYAKYKDDCILYYDLEKNPIQLAKATCRDCGDVMESKRCGDFVSCKCGESFVDTDRWFPERHRYGGNCVPIHVLT